MIGRTLAHYKILEKIGEGGMGEVWRAVDTTLDREVAIKVLPEFFAKDPDRLARFDREAKVLASLNHSGIAVIHGLHETAPSTDSAEGAVRFLAMEYVPGEDLAERLQRGPLSVSESLFVGAQVAEALEAAHAQGVIHRDLKPGNIVLAPDGKAKVLDFGLAKSFETEGQASSGSPTYLATVTSAGTAGGVLLGTAAYMSPEQARGKPVDRRTDIWAFGCVLYECLTAHGVYRGDTVSDSLGAILHKEPDWNRLPEETPPAVRLMLRRCLTKDAGKRLHDIADARIELEAAISPDGSEVAYIHSGQLWVQFLDELEPRLLDENDDAIAPFWSPDSEEIAYFAGGRPVAICDLGGELSGGRGTSWSEGGRIVFTSGNTGLLEVAALGGEARELLALDKGVLFVAHPTGESPGDFQLLQDGERRILFETENQRLRSPVYATSGQILFLRTGSDITDGIWALPFSLGDLSVEDEPFLVVPDAGGEHFSWFDRSGRRLDPIGETHDQIGTPVLSPDGRWLAFTYSAEEGGGTDLWVRDLARGTETRLTHDAAFEFMISWAPSGREIIYSRFLDGEGVSYSSVLSDGRLVAYVSDRSGRDEIYLTRFPDATGRWQVSVDGGTRPVIWDANSGRLHYVEGSRLMGVTVGDGPEPRLGKPEPVLSDLPLLRRGVAISSDGERFVAVVAGEEQSETDQQRRSGIKLVQNWYREFEACQECRIRSPIRQEIHERETVEEGVRGPGPAGTGLA